MLPVLLKVRLAAVRVMADSVLPLLLSTAPPLATVTPPTVTLPPKRAPAATEIGLLAERALLTYSVPPLTTVGPL